MILIWRFVNTFFTFSNVESRWQACLEQQGLELPNFEQCFQFLMHLDLDKVTKHIQGRHFVWKHSALSLFVIRHVHKHRMGVFAVQEFSFVLHAAPPLLQFINVPCHFVIPTRTRILYAEGSRLFFDSTGRYITTSILFKVRS